MSVAWVLVLLFSVQDVPSSVRHALDERDFRGAWARMLAEPDALVRARERTEILYRAGDPAGALAAARAGLALAPEQLELLYHAAGAAIWIQDALSAAEYSARLQRAVEDDLELASEDRTA